MTRTPGRRPSPRYVAAYRRLAGGYAADPCGYAEQVLGAALTPQQRAIPALLGRPPYRLLVPSANKVGKTFAAGWLINWFFDSFDPGVCLTTSATYRSVKTQVFKEVRKLRPLGLDLKPKTPELFHHDTHQVIGFSTANPDAFQGQHEGRWLLLFDEATAVPAELSDRAETMFQGLPGHGWVAFYNPNDPTTWPYAAEQSGGWAVHRLSALDHPNVAAELRGEPPPFPNAVRLHRIRQRIARECEDWGDTKPDADGFQFPDETGRERWHKPADPRFNPQVRGRWPAVAAGAVWSEADKHRCSGSVEIDPDWPVQVGCDVARTGDRTTFAVRKGVALVHLEERRAWPTRRVSQHIADRLRELCHRYAPPGVSPKRVPCAVDETGGYGAGVVDYPEGYTFVGVNSSRTARDPEQYPNTRSELWLVARLAADEGGVNTGTVGEGAELVDQLWKELTAARYSVDKKGRLVVEGKSQIKERLGESPDLADGMNLAWYPVAG